MLRLLLLFWFLNPLIAQLPGVYLSKKQLKAFGTMPSSSPLVVVIENEKNADDAALIASLKKYWKAGPIKYMSSLEFSEKFKANSLDHSNFYLYNNIQRDPGATVMAQSIAYRSGFYLTNDPIRLIKSQSDKKAPPYLYFPGSMLYDRKNNPVQGYYSLMVKNFNHDMNYYRQSENYTTKKKLNRKSGVVYFKPEELKSKTVLLVKEQTERKENEKRSKKSKKKKKKEKEEFISDPYTFKNTPTIVFHEDVEHALKISDPKILLYTGASVYSAEDGSVYSTGRQKNGKMPFYVIQIAGAAVSVALLILIL